MSEFSVGVLFSQENKHKVENYIKTDDLGFVKDLNEDWAVLLVEDQWLQNPSTVEWLLELSKACPLLYLANAEDHGWEYHIFNEGADVAAAKVDYDLETTLAFAISEEKYPGEDAISILDQLYDELEESGEYVKAIEQNLSRKNVESFRLFDVGSRQVRALDELLTTETLLQEEGLLDLIEQFKEIINIEEFCWISYEYVEPDFDEDEDF